MEKNVKNYLKERLNVPVNVQRHPEQEKQVVLQKTGTSSDNYIQTATIAVQSFAPTYKEAYELNKIAINELKGMESQDDIVNVNKISDYPAPYPTEGVFRYQAVVIITHY